jgi:hypothetical protein
MADEEMTRRTLDLVDEMEMLPALIEGLDVQKNR